MKSVDLPLLQLRQHRDFIKIMIKDYHFNINKLEIENSLDTAKIRLWKSSNLTNPKISQ